MTTGTPTSPGGPPTSSRNGRPVTARSQRAAQAKIRRFEADTQREPTPDERFTLWASAQRETRPPKQHDPDPHTRWQAEAEALGVDTAATVGALPDAARRDPDAYDRAELVVTRPGQAITDVVTDEVVAQLEQLGRASGGLSRPDILRTVWSTLVASPHLVGHHTDTEAELGRLAADLWDRVTDRLVERDGRWRSPGLASAEVAAVCWLAADAAPSAATADTEGLGGDQAAAVATILDADTRGVLVIGPAGAGKTEMLGRVAAAVGPDRVLAVAPTAEAAANLGEALDVVGETAARAAVSDDLVPAGGWVIVDEAGQLDTRTLAALSGRADAAGARMVLVGDTAQQGSVGAGGVFQALAERPDLVPAAVLSQLWRFADIDEARATVGLRRGDTDALGYHAERGRIHDSTESELPTVAADWWSERRDQDAIVTAPTLRLVAEINTEIAARRQSAGETGDAVLGAGDATIRIGDTVTTRRNQRRLVASDGQWVRNGDRWEITGTLAGGGVTAQRLDGSATVEIPAVYAGEHVQLGYATTQARVQSLTVDSALCAVTVSSRRNQLYVGMTRGRAENHLLVVTDQPQHDPDIPPDHLPPKKIIDTIMQRGESRRLTIPAGTHMVAPGLAAAHLRRVADTSHRQPLPDLAALDPRRVLASETGRAAGVGVEDVIGGAIGEWLDDELAAAALEDDAARAWEESLLDALDQGHDIEALQAPVVDNPDTWLPPDNDDYSPADAAPLPTAPPPTIHTTVADPAPPAADLPDPAEVEAALDVVVDTWGADHYAPFLTLADQWAQTAAPPPHDDPGPLVALTARYQNARRVGDQRTAAHTVALMNAVADPTLHAMLSPLVRHPLTTTQRQWAADVRSQLRARRAERWRPTLDAVDTTRRRLRGRLPTGGAVTPARAAEHDQQRWYEAVAAWIDDGASAARLSSVWHSTNRQTAQALLGLVAAVGDGTQQPPWDPTSSERYDPPSPLPDGLADVAAAQPPTPAKAARGDGHDAARKVLARSAAWYHHQLLNAPGAAGARRYLTDRGIDQHDWAKWQLGWAPAQWRGLTNTLRDDTAAVEAGVATTSKGRTYDVLRGRVVFPIRDTAGDVLAFAGRKLPGDTQPAKYLNTRTTALYHKSDTLYGIAEAADAIAHGGTAGVVEGYTDAIAAHKAGLDHVVATGGTAFTDSHLTRIVAAGAHHLTAGFDGDHSGQAAQQRVVDQAHQAAVPTTAVTFPAGEDPASLSPDALHQHWNAGLPQPWTHIHQHLDGGDIHQRIRGHRTLADTYTASDPVITAIATHQSLVHTHGATPTTIAAWHPHSHTRQNQTHTQQDRNTSLSL